MSKILVFGEVIWDMYPEQATIGGAPFNFAAHASQLGDEVWLLTAVGTDERGEMALAKMREYGIRTELVQKNAHETGKATLTLDAEKKPHFVIHTDAAYDHITVDDGVLAAIRAIGADVFCFSTLIQRSEPSRKALRTVLDACPFDTVLCDLNIRKGCWDIDAVRYCLEHATVLKMSIEDMDPIFDSNIIRPWDTNVLKDIARTFPNLRTVALTWGGEGSRVLDTESMMIHYSPKPAPGAVVSTVGAGDCYAATLLHELLNGTELPSAIETATKRCDKVVASIEAVPAKTGI